MIKNIFGFAVKVALLSVIFGFNAYAAEKPSKGKCQANDHAFQGTTWQSKRSNMTFKGCQLTIVQAGGCKIAGDYQTKFYPEGNRTVISFAITSSCSPAAEVNHMTHDNAVVGGKTHIVVTTTGSTMTVYGYGTDIADTLTKM